MYFFYVENRMTEVKLLKNGILDDLQLHNIYISILYNKVVREWYFTSNRRRNKQR